MRPTDLIDTGNGTIAIGSRRPITRGSGSPLRHPLVRGRHRQVEQRRRGQDRPPPRRRTPRPVRRALRVRHAAVARLQPGESARHACRDPSTWTDSTLASVSMGYEVGVTPLQMAAAASAVANGGELVQPRVVRAVIDGDRRQPVPRTVIRRVTSPETAAEMTSIMEGVVERGTAQAREARRTSPSPARPGRRARSSGRPLLQTRRTTRRSSASCRPASRR